MWFIFIAVGAIEIGCVVEAGSFYRSRAVAFVNVAKYVYFWSYCLYEVQKPFAASFVF